MQNKEIETFYPKNQQQWRKWLNENHQAKQSIWILQYKKGTGKPTIGWSEAVDEALCFGWIDSTRRTVDNQSFIQFFCKRKPKSVWSKINKAKVMQLIASGLMTQAGYDSIAIAKQNGSWIALDEVEELFIPADLVTKFDLTPGSRDFFMSLSKSTKKAILQWIILAKRPETRQKRITELVTLASQKLKPKQF